VPVSEAGSIGESVLIGVSVDVDGRRVPDPSYQDVQLGLAQVSYDTITALPAGGHLIDVVVSISPPSYPFSGGSVTIGPKATLDVVGLP
jgi:hypothetical protein